MALNMIYLQIINQQKNQIMKRIIMLFVALISMSALFSQKPTTQEEYNYLTKGYRIQIESGLDMKKGYTMKDILVDVTLSTGIEKRSTSYKGLYRDGETRPCAILLIYKRLDNNSAPFYFCIPTSESDPSLWQKTIEQINTNFQNQNNPMLTLIFGLMHFSVVEKQ